MLCQQDPPRKVAPLIGWNVVKTVIKRIQDRNRYALIVLRGLVKTDFKLRYQGSFLGVAWSVLKPLMLFAVMYMVFAKFLRMSDLPRGAADGYLLVEFRVGGHLHRPAFHRGSR